MLNHEVQVDSYKGYTITKDKRFYYCRELNLIGYSGLGKIKGGILKIIKYGYPVGGETANTVHYAVNAFRPWNEDRVSEGNHISQLDTEERLHLLQKGFYLDGGHTLALSCLI